jgi:hypothetical protein
LEEAVEADVSGIISGILRGWTEENLEIPVRIAILRDC